VSGSRPERGADGRLRVAGCDAVALAFDERATVAVDGGLSDNLEPLYGIRFDALHAAGAYTYSLATTTTASRAPRSCSARTATRARP
jgi:hypothetical protein